VRTRFSPTEPTHLDVGLNFRTITIVDDKAKPSASVPDPARERGKTAPYVKICLIALLLTWLGPGVAWLISGGNAKATFLILSISYLFVGLVFLLFCVQLGELSRRFQRTMPFNPVLLILDATIRHMFVVVGYPTSRRAWIVTNVLLAVYFFGIAIVGILFATGHTQAEQAITRWIEQAFQWFRQLRGM
jgi:hypothetical protein